jgi:Fur family ferric uptake transcriptional regulator
MLRWGVFQYPPGSNLIMHVPASQAESLIRATGARVTRARTRVLAALLAAERALTHHEVEERLRKTREIDRVTVYRVLDWLTHSRLAHKIAGDDRVWRFNAREHEVHEHAHFSCTECGTVVCLEAMGARPSLKLPAGFRTRHIDVTVKGTCASCAPSMRARRS